MIYYNYPPYYYMSPKRPINKYPIDSTESQKERLNHPYRNIRKINTFQSSMNTINTAQNSSSIINSSSHNVASSSPSSIRKEKADSRSNNNDVLFEIFGIKLYFDDLLLICLIFFLYTEGVQDQYLFFALILLLLS